MKILFTWGISAKMKLKTECSGLTLVELIIASVVVLVVILGLAVVFIGSHRAYEVLYDQVNADVVTDGYYVRRLFDTIMRKSSSSGITVDENGEWVEARYYESGTSVYPDRYARFFTSGTELKVEYGTVDSANIKQTLDVSTACGNVASCVFKSSGNSAVMVLKLDSGDKANTIVSSAYLHN